MTSTMKEKKGSVIARQSKSRRHIFNIMIENHASQYCTVPLLNKFFGRPRCPMGRTVHPIP